MLIFDEARLRFRRRDEAVIQRNMGAMSKGRTSLDRCPPAEHATFHADRIITMEAGASSPRAENDEEPAGGGRAHCQACGTKQMARAQGGVRHEPFQEPCAMPGRPNSSGEKDDSGKRFPETAFLPARL